MKKQSGIGAMLQSDSEDEERHYDVSKGIDAVQEEQESLKSKSSKRRGNRQRT